jgi:hypothetical protein
MPPDCSSGALDAANAVLIDRLGISASANIARSRLNRICSSKQNGPNGAGGAELGPQAEGPKQAQTVGRTTQCRGLRFWFISRFAGK